MESATLRGSVNSLPQRLHLQVSASSPSNRFANVVPEAVKGGRLRKFLTTLFASLPLNLTVGSDCRVCR
jgi:hypothetical protein